MTIDRETYWTGINVLKSMHGDMTDGMWPDLQEVFGYVQEDEYEGLPVDYSVEADAINEVLADWGHNHIFRGGEEL